MPPDSEMWLECCKSHDKGEEAAEKSALL